MKYQKNLNNNIIGPSRKYPFPIQLDPSYYEGAIVYADDGELYYSDGTEWKNPTIDLPEDIWRGDIDLDGDNLRSLRLRRKTTLDNESFVGEDGQVIVDTDKNTLVVHDGSESGGSTLVAEDSSQSISNKTFDLADTTIVGINGNGLNLSSGELEVDSNKVVLTSGSQSIDGQKTFNDRILINDEFGIGTNQSTFNLIPQNATSVNFANAGTDISIGSGQGQTTINHDLIVGNDLIVQGETFSISEDIIVLDDKVLSLLSLDASDDPEPTDALASGGGIQLNGDTLKEFKWYNSTGAWTSSENLDIPSDKAYMIDGTNVLSSGTLESSITDSSLTSVGTLVSGTWNADVITTEYGGTGHTSYIDGQLLIGNSFDNTLSKARLTQGSGILITNGNGSIEIANSDPGSGQNIFKNVADASGNVEFSADNNDDTIRFEGAGTATIQFDATTNTVTFNAPETGFTAGDGIDITNEEISVDDTVVRTSGNQTISGAKSFNDILDADITSNAGTATALETPRSINGVPFDGTEDINISISTDESLTAGDGLTGGSFDGSVARTFDNADKGSDQPIFKRIVDETNTDQIIANSNDDSLGFIAGIGNQIDFDSSANTITITATGEETPEPDVFKNIANSNSATQFSADGIDDTIQFEGSGGTSVSFDVNNKSVIISSSTQSDEISIQNDASTNADLFPLFADSTGANVAELYASDTKLTFNPSTGTFSASNFNSLSDSRYKTNVRTINSALDKVESLRGVEFDWKETDRSSIGFIAQELEEVLPDLVHTNDSGIKSVSYGNVVALLVEAVKEQQKTINQLVSERGRG